MLETVVKLHTCPLNGLLAQLGERDTVTVEATGSKPVQTAKYCRSSTRGVHFTVDED